MLRPGPAVAHNPRSVVLARWLAFRGPAARKAAYVEYCCRGETMLSRQALSMSLVRRD